MAFRDIKELPSDLTIMLFDLGLRKLVLVEGPTDRAVFREWFLDRLGEVEFYAAGGRKAVETYLPKVHALSTSTKPREFGIIDRDFRSDEEVETSLNDPNAHLFILRRYAIENYLLEPAAVAEEVRLLSEAEPTVAEVQTQLLRLCSDLHSMMAANWLFSGRDAEFFPEGHDLMGRPFVVQRVSQQLGCSEAEADAHLAVKEASIAPLLTTLDTAYMRVNGKHLLFHIHKMYIKKELKPENLCKYLARTVKQRLGLHEDIIAIVEQRILA